MGIAESEIKHIFSFSRYFETFFKELSKFLFSAVGMIWGKLRPRLTFKKIVLGILCKNRLVGHLGGSIG